MASVSADSRGISPVVATVLLVAIVLLLSGAAMSMATAFGPGENPPEAAFETEQGHYLTIQHDSGDIIDSGQITVSGGDAWAIPDELDSGTEIEVQPDSGVDELSLIWASNEESYILQTFDMTDRDVSAGPEPMPPQPTDCFRISSDQGTTVDRAGECVVVEEGVTLSNNINGATDVYLQRGATVTGDVNPSGDIVLRSGTEIGGQINSGEDLYMGEQATIGGNVQVSEEMVVRSGSTLDQNVNSGTALYLLPGAEVTGDTNVQVYASNASAQVGGSINSPGADDVYE